MAQNLKEIMVALDKVLNSTVWVNSKRQIVSLAEEMHKSNNGQPMNIEDLVRAALTGAYVSLQIRLDDFSVAAEGLETSDLAAKVKEMVFAEARKALNIGSTEKVAMAA